MRRVILAISGILLLLTACTTDATEHGGQHSKDSTTTSLVARDPSPDTNPIKNDSSANDRENWQKPQMVISRLGDLSVRTVADIGAGTGYFTMRLARKAKKVIAIDIDEKFLNYIDRRVSKTRDTMEHNIETRLTDADDPSLHPDEADLVLIVNTYPYINDRVNYFQKVWSGIAEGGRLVVIDFKKKKLPVGPNVEDKVSAPMVVTQLDSAGFSPIQIDSSALEFQYMVTAFKYSTGTSHELSKGNESSAPGTL